LLQYPDLYETINFVLFNLGTGCAATACGVDCPGSD
jgi:hypothetical protein